MRRVRREAVVEGRDASDLGECRGVGFQQVRERRLNAVRVLRWVAPGAAVDVAVCMLV